MSNNNKKEGLIKLVSIGWLRLIATPSENLINKEFAIFEILHVFLIAKNE